MKKLNRKFRNYFLLFVIILALIMVVFQLFSVRKITADFYSEYGENVLSSKSNLIQYLNHEFMASMDLISEISLDDEVYVEDIIEGYLIYNTFTDVFVFDENNRSVYLSNKEYGDDYEEIILKIYENYQNINYQDMFYSRNINSFVWIRKTNDSEGDNAKFLFINDGEIFEKRIVNSYEYENLYVIDKNGVVFYPQDYQDEIGFDFENCFDNKDIKYSGVIEYNHDIFQNSCVFWVLDSESINESVNINHEIIIIFSTALIAFLIFILLFYIFRGEFE